MLRPVFIPGVISVAFYKRRPSSVQIILGLAATIALSALLGYIQDAGTSRVWLNMTEAAIGGVIIYLAILAYLIYRYQPRRLRNAPAPTSPGHEKDAGSP